MFYRIITGDKALSTLFILIIALLTWMPAFFKPEFISPSLSFQMPLDYFIRGTLRVNVLILNLIAFLLIIIQGFMLVRISTKYIVVQKRTFLPALFYIIISGYIPELQQLNGLLIANFFIIFIINILIISPASEPNSYGFFNTGLFIGLGSLFYAPLLYFLLFIWISTLILRTFYWREFLFPVLGIITPYILLLGGMFLYRINLTEFFEMMIDQLYNGSHNFNMDLPNKIFVTYTILLFLIANVYLLKVYQFKKNYIRNFFLIMFWLFIITLIVFTIVSGFNKYLTYILSIPIVYILTNYFVTTRNTWGNKLLLYIFILGIIFVSMNEWMKW